MDYQEMEELLYTDMEVRQEMEETHRRRVRSTQKRPRIVDGAKQAGILQVDERDGGIESANCPKLGSPIQWPIRTCEPLGEGMRMSWESMERSELGMAG
jgi:hypothetical protein